jgi:hypothetical protein
MTTASTINAIFQKRDMQNSWIESQALKKQTTPQTGA